MRMHLLTHGMYLVFIFNGTFYVKTLLTGGAYPHKHMIWFKESDLKRCPHDNQLLQLFINKTLVVKDPSGPHQFHIHVHIFVTSSTMRMTSVDQILKI